MKIAFCTPFKPIDHPSISGDVTIARDLVATLEGYGHAVVPVEYFPAKEIYWKPGRWAEARAAVKTMVEQAYDADCWLTYGSYYKVPDVFGPTVTKRLGLPYFIFQASYAENRKKRLATWPGYRLNRRAMLRADHVFCNRMNDVTGCAKLLADDHYSYLKPGLPGGIFQRDEVARLRLREQWQVGDSPVIVTAAMMRHGVKAVGLEWVIETCTELVKSGRDLTLVVAGEGPRRQAVEALAKEQLGDRVRFLGMVERDDLSGVFSAGDLFVFPGLEESVGMVYLEAQQCGLPVVATDDEGAAHVIRDGYSGIVTPVDKGAFTQAVDRLLMDDAFRTTLGRQAMEYVQHNHESSVSYRDMARLMESLVQQRKTA
ncbi:glycosyltransferase family 4 protein [Pseudodesulfovibrio sp.]|nr:glycosyltransferase family 4 protein [Pseudodesulfovibrio sp.]